MKNYSTIKKCRISEVEDLIQILDLGEQPLANSLKKNQFETKKNILLVFLMVKKVR